VMSDITNAIDPSEISAPVQRGLAALGRLKIQDTGNDHLGNGTSFDGSPTGKRSSPLDSDQSAMYTPGRSSDGNSMQGDDHSPYSVLNNILWGTSDYAHPETLVM
jgi:hypothetical protein